MSVHWKSGVSIQPCFSPLPPITLFTFTASIFPQYLFLLHLFLVLSTACPFPLYFFDLHILNASYVFAFVSGCFTSPFRDILSASSTFSFLRKKTKSVFGMQQSVTTCTSDIYKELSCMNLLHVTGYGSSPNPSPVWIHSPHNCGNKSFFCQLRSNTSPHNIYVYFYGEFWKVSLKNAFVSIICIQWNSFNLSQSVKQIRKTSARVWLLSSI